MPKTRDFRFYLEDIVNAINEISEFIKELNFETFKKDKKTIAAVIRNLEIIGEAIKNIPEEIRLKFQDIPWKELAGMRDKLIHGYFGVDLEIVWKSITIEIPSFKKEFALILKILSQK